MNQRHYIGMHGLGDNIFQRPFIRAVMGLYEVYLETPWPQLYSDLPIKLVKKQSILRTQAKNMVRTPADVWAPGPQGGQRRVAYNLSGGSIINAFEECFNTKLNPDYFDLPPLPPPPIVSQKPIVFVRPVTARTEWLNEARNPRPEYIAAICDYLRPSHHIVTVADVADRAEWFVGDPPKADSVFCLGELPVMDMLSLAASAALILGGVGWIVPAAIALKRPCFIVLGGQGGHNAPARITDPRLDLSRIGFAKPEVFCPCTDMRHQCEKTIPDLMPQFLTWYGGQVRNQACNGLAN
jgi:hypothetical protein